MMTAKVFENGRSQAVRLPKEFLFLLLLKVMENTSRF